MTLNYTRLDRRAVLRIAGEEAANFLQGLITNDIHKAKDGQAIYAALLTPQGKYLHDFLIVEKDGTYWLDCEKARLEDLKKRLTMYRLRSKVTIEDKSETYAVLALSALPSQAVEGMLVFSDPREAKLGARAFVERSALTQIPADWQERTADYYDHQRIALCVPESSVDLLPEKSFPLECNFEALHGVDFDKGCYVGQEVTTRTKRRGVVRKKLFSVTVDGPLPAPGTAITAEGKEVGDIRSGSGDRAIALIRLEALEGDNTLMAEDVPLRVTAG